MTVNGYLESLANNLILSDIEKIILSDLLKR